MQLWIKGDGSNGNVPRTSPQGAVPAPEHLKLGGGGTNLKAGAKVFIGFSPGKAHRA